MLMTEEGQVFAYALARYLPMPSAWMVRRDIIICHPFDPDVGGGLEDGAWWLSTWNSVRKYRLSEPLIRYRVRGHSSSTASPSKRRKLAFAKLSTLPMTRWLLRAVTYMLHGLSKRPYYVPVKSWDLPDAPHAAR
jgi:hypothetical protein